MKELYREFAAARLRYDDAVEMATLGAFQTVRVWALTKSKKGKMPDFKTLLPKAQPTGRSEGRQSHAQMEAMMHMLAARVGATVKNPRLKGGAA